jgi:hypothetical protein
MLSKVKTLNGYKMVSRDGVIGKVKGFYFDDHHWTIRYLVAETGDWLMSRQVLISPYALASVNKEERYIKIDLTKKQIEDSPSIDSDKPVPRQFEEVYCGYYGWPMYAGGPYIWGAYPYIERDRKKWQGPAQSGKAWDSHLRSTREVSGYHILANDGEIGHVEDFIIEDELWVIRYLIIDTHNWWPGKRVLISPEWIERVSWEESKITVDLFREIIKRAPEYTDGSLVSRDYEDVLHHHYSRQGYWLDALAAKEKATECQLK